MDFITETKSTVQAAIITSLNKEGKVYDYLVSIDAKTALIKLQNCY
jgi:hypothetical protein